MCLPLCAQLDVFDAADRYQQSGVPLLILAGQEYGSGSSRDWAAKGPFLLVSFHHAVDLQSWLMTTAAPLSLDGDRT